FINVELLLPVALSDDDAGSNRFRVWNELAVTNDGNGQVVLPVKCRRSICIAERRLVHFLDQISRLLKLNRQKERRRSVDALDVGARLIAGASGDVAYPELKTARVGHAIQKIYVLLLDVEIGIVDGDELRRICSGSHAQRFDLHVAVIQ